MVTLDKYILNTLTNYCQFQFSYFTKHLSYTSIYSVVKK